LLNARPLRHKQKMGSQPIPVKQRE
jgi:hypothetical protein